MHTQCIAWCYLHHDGISVKKKSFDTSYHIASDVIFDQLLYHFSILMIFTILAHLVMIPQILSTPVILPIPLIVPFFLSFNS